MPNQVPNPELDFPELLLKQVPLISICPPLQLSAVTGGSLTKNTLQPLGLNSCRGNVKSLQIGILCISPRAVGSNTTLLLKYYPWAFYSGT